MVSPHESPVQPRVHLEVDSRRRIRRVGCRDARRITRRQVLPAQIIGRKVRVYDVVGFDPPDAIKLHVRVLVDATHPGAVLAVIAHHAEGSGAHLCGLAIRGDIDDRLVLHMIVQHAVIQALLAIQVQITPHGRLARVDAA
jgi:hypothetical protein